MGNISKTIRYFKRNGIGDTLYAIMERLLPQRGVPFDKEKEAHYDSDDFGVSEEDILFSIIVPVYETKEPFLRAMIESCLNQTYGNFELILADASGSDIPGRVIKSYDDSRIKYVRLTENLGISGNSNRALEEAKGDYAVLLDHDDLLTADALSVNAAAIKEARKAGHEALFLYSDEDKCDDTGNRFFMPHFKEKFNLDLLISNNYICHLSVIRADIIKNLKFREGFDGAQDHDLFLRAADSILYKNGRYDTEAESTVIHINKILYHWRSYGESTAFDPASKEYAYDAGLRAAGEFVQKHFGECEVTHLKHRGFYGVEESGNLFTTRPELGAAGGMAIRGNKVVNGIIREDGSDYYRGMNKRFSGYMHKADLRQLVYALDIRTLVPAPDFKVRYEELLSEFNGRAFEQKSKSTDALAREYGLKFGKLVAESGRRILFDPKRNRLV